MNYKRGRRKNKGKDIFEYVWGFKGNFIKDYSGKKEWKNNLKKGIL